MGKHNGKSRKTGSTVGLTLANRNTQRNKDHKRDGRHTTDIGPEKGPNMQSIIERNDLDEFLAMAELQGREFAGERGTNDIIVISEGAVTALDTERSEEERAAVETRNAHKLTIPRRPEWDESTTRDELDDMEKAMFLGWRRDLAKLEEDEKLCLTPFEKNLEVWRQLWRVLERSDCIVQVVDARDPLRYYSEDLVSYAYDINPTKHSILLLNKADLLTVECRTAWADYFDKEGLDYIFWSARDATEAAKVAKMAAKVHEAGGFMPLPTNKPQQIGVDKRVQVLSIDELILRLERFSANCVAEARAAGGEGTEDPAEEAKMMVGLVGYPNVGKSSTINALYGSKKTSVAPTPGKTKHFQTLLLEGCKISLCDCPGLVLPRFAASKGEMVAAGVVPIDRLTDVMPPVDTVARRVTRKQFCKVYGTKLARPAAHEDPNRPPRASELIASLSLTRGWISGSGLPDETRAGRQILKDYVDGKLVYLVWPPGVPEHLVKHTPVYPSDDEETEGAHHGSASAEAEEELAGGGASTTSASQGASTSKPAPQYDDADLELLAADGVSGGKPRRADHKFHKKAARSKGSRGQVKEVGADGVGVMYGKKGGLVRVTGA